MTVPDDGDVRTLAPNLSHGPEASAPSRVTPSPVPPAAGRVRGSLAELPVISGEPALYDFAYVSKPATIGGMVVKGGLLVFPSNGHANVTYDLGGRYDAFMATIGAPDTAPSSVRMVFRAFVDGQVMFPGRAVRAGGPPIPVKIAVKGAHTLLLDVEADGAPDGAQPPVSALWGEPRLLGSH